MGERRRVAAEVPMTNGVSVFIQVKSQQIVKHALIHCTIQSEKYRNDSSLEKLRGLLYIHLIKIKNNSQFGY